MIGKEPEIFTGDWDKVEEFMTSWSMYHGINKQTRVMNTHNDAANIRWARKSARANCSISSVERAWTHRV